MCAVKQNLAQSKSVCMTEVHFAFNPYSLFTLISPMWLSGQQKLIIGGGGGNLMNGFCRQTTCRTVDLSG